MTYDQLASWLFISNILLLAVGCFIGYGFRKFREAKEKEANSIFITIPTDKETSYDLLKLIVDRMENIKAMNSKSEEILKEQRDKT